MKSSLRALNICPKDVINFGPHKLIKEQEDEKQNYFKAVNAIPR